MITKSFDEMRENLSKNEAPIPEAKVFGSGKYPLTPAQSKAVQRIIPGCSLFSVCKAESGCYQQVNKDWIICRYFKESVLPSNPGLYAAVIGNQAGGKKTCCLCNRVFIPRNNRQRYCPECQSTGNRLSAKLRKRKQRERGYDVTI